MSRRSNSARPTRLRLCDIRLAYEIVNECRELWADPAAWRQHLVEGAARLTGMTLGHYAEALIVRPDSTPRFSCHTAADLPRGSDWKVYEASLAEYPDIFDFFIGSKRLLNNLAPGKLAAALREELCSDSDWYASKVYNEFRRPIRADDNAISVFRHDEQLYTVLDTNQNSGDARMTECTKRQLAFLHGLVGPLVGTELATEHQHSVHGLTPQLRATLTRLLAGDSEKKIAAHLGIREATANEYVGKLYRHFGVHSRAELMAYFIRRRPS